jgi:hypothetical protein
MKHQNSQFPFVKLPASLDLTLFLIREELKSQKFFNGIQQLGISDCYYQPHLGKAILAQLNMDDGSDEIYEFYYKLIDKRSKKISADYKSLMKQTMKVYVKLTGEKERRRIGC